ncbi:MAG TPA: RNA 2',3'-cyclic phosphodiesterase [Streptosporangiaceae bacterium]|nr:RNA 2',3'-cyclic phosphodiesterase [Streptosporangiaceae bacterium]
MRLFVAVAVPAEAADELEAAVAPLRDSWPGLRWTGRDAWHLTLAFLGEVNEAVCARLVPRLERAAARHPFLSLSLGGAGAFPGAARARVLWTGVQGERRALGALAASVAAGARRAGAPPGEEGRRFQPHLTLARCRAPVDARSLVTSLSGYAGTPWIAHEIYLIRSHPPNNRQPGTRLAEDGQEGQRSSQDGSQQGDQHARPRYETLGSWPLHVPAVPGADPAVPATDQ